MASTDSILEAITSYEADIALEPFRFETAKQNQMLFFIKPEVFLLEINQAKEVCRFMLSHIDSFGIDVAGVYMLSSEHLKSKHIMDRHYGYINEISRTASHSISADDGRVLRHMCNASADTPILGGHEVLERYSTLTPASLDRLWSTKASKKLRSGLYFEIFEIDGLRIIIANGFHPNQLDHFTADGRRICLFLLNSDLPWKVLRSQMLGDTFPERAADESIRGHLNRHAKHYGFAEVTIANNCAHMSAGAFEAVLELKNFLSGADVGFQVERCRMADYFRTWNLGTPELETAVNNPILSGPLDSQRLFDATEECDAASATAVYAQCRSR